MVNCCLPYKMERGARASPVQGEVARRTGGIVNKDNPPVTALRRRQPPLHKGAFGGCAAYRINNNFPYQESTPGGFPLGGDS